MAEDRIIGGIDWASARQHLETLCAKVARLEVRTLESLKGKTCCEQVKFYSGVYACLAEVLPFKDSEGGTWFLDLFDFNWSYICRHAPGKKQTQYANRAKAFAPHQNFGPAIREAAEPRCATPSATKLPDTPCWSEARPR
jgi:hypothetical protein